ncbi:MAG: hypothetical protein LBM19_00225 [Holosporales bacterium]|jgi:hypothetical protein|nr:hypothetical protein [Holosporales bacterium]
MTYKIKKEGNVSATVESRFNLIEKKLTAILENNKKAHKKEYTQQDLIRLFDDENYTLQAYDIGVLKELYQKLNLGCLDVTSDVGVYYSLEKIRNAIRNINKKWREM